jgi:WD40 repeat protein
VTLRIGTALIVLAVGVLAGCGAPTSSEVSVLAVNTATSGSDLDPDGYVLRVDDRTLRRIGDADTIVELLAGNGSHRLVLSEVARNCTLSGDSVRTISGVPGDTARESFDVTCGATTGTLRVTTLTSGAEIDPNGYLIVIDGIPEPARTNPTSVYSTDITSGDHTVGLSDVTPNCSSQDGLSRGITIGSATNQDVAFTLTCMQAEPAGAGHEIAFSTDRLPRDGQAPQRIYVMNDDGTGLRAGPGLQNGFLFGLRWLPGGATLSFLSQPKDEGVTFATFSTLVVATGVIDTLLNVHAFDVPEWSPDGSLVAYTDNLDVDEGGLDQVWVAGSEPDDRRQISSDAVPHRSPTWSRDGTRLAYAGRGDNAQGESSQILVRPLTGGVETPILTDFPGSVHGLAWSPDGSRIAFEGITDPRRVPGEEVPQIYTVEATGGEPTRLTGGRVGNSQPTWSPDGLRIAFSSERDGNEEIYIMNADGSEQTRLTNDPGRDADPAWRP